jgi:hypothetical protein
LIQSWAESPKTGKAAKDLLESTKVFGISVSSDSSGLSKLSREKSLIEVLSFISQPKEIVYGLGKSIGGVGIGVWAADNTQMFYPSSVSPDTVLSTLIEIQYRISSFLVKIGLGAHYGTFYKIGGGLYGEEADFIEHIAEDEVPGGEIVISECFMQQLGNTQQYQYQERTDLKNDFSKLYCIINGPRNPDVSCDDYHYPIPYSESFFEDIRHIGSQSNQEKIVLLENKYISQKVVVLIEREKLEEDILEVETLNNLSFDTLMSKTAHELLPQYHGEDIKTVSSLGIYVFNDPIDALSFAEHFQQQLLQDDGVRCKIGIDEGPVIIFNIKKGRKDIAGSPVNVASKIAQDKGEFGHIYISEEIEKKTKPIGYTQFEITVSGIVLPGYVK